MYASIFLISNLKGLTHGHHRLHVDECVAQPFLKLWIPSRAHTVTSMSVVSSGRLHLEESI